VRVPDQEIVSENFGYVVPHVEDRTLRDGGIAVVHLQALAALSQDHRDLRTNQAEAHYGCYLKYAQHVLLGLTRMGEVGRKRVKSIGKFQKLPFPG